MKQLILKDSNRFIIIPNNFELCFKQCDEGLLMSFENDETHFYTTILYVEDEKIELMNEFLFEGIYSSLEDDLTEYIGCDICEYLQKGIYYTDEENQGCEHPYLDLEFYASKWQNYLDYPINQRYRKKGESPNKKEDK